MEAGEARRLAGERVDGMFENRHGSKGTVTSVDISGTCDDRFAVVKDAFAGNFEPDSEPVDVGAAVAVTVEGELVVDLWGGMIRGDDGVERSWQPNTIINGVGRIVGGRRPRCSNVVRLRDEQDG